MICEDCRFYQTIEFGGEDHERFGWCKRYAPRPALEDREKDPDISWEPAWPEVRATQSCGEWEPALVVVCELNTETLGEVAIRPWEVGAVKVPRAGTVIIRVKDQR
jgi:hypothetical protein